MKMQGFITAALANVRMFEKLGFGKVRRLSPLLMSLFSNVRVLLYALDNGHWCRLPGYRLLHTSPCPALPSLCHRPDVLWLRSRLTGTLNLV